MAIQSITMPGDPRQLTLGLQIREWGDGVVIAWTDLMPGNLPGNVYEAGVGDLVEFDRGPVGRRYQRAWEEGELGDEELLCVFALEHPDFESGFGTRTWTLDDAGRGLVLALSEARVCLSGAGFDDRGPGSVAWSHEQALWLPHDRIEHSWHQGLLMAAREVVSAVREARPVDWRRLSIDLGEKAAAIREQAEALIAASPERVPRGERPWRDLTRVPGYCAAELMDGRLAFAPTDAINRNDMFMSERVPGSFAIECGGMAQEIIEALSPALRADADELHADFREAMIGAILDEEGNMRLPVTEPLWAGMPSDIARRRQNRDDFGSLAREGVAGAGVEFALPPERGTAPLSRGGEER